MRKVFNYSFLVIFLFSFITIIYLLFNLSETSNGQFISALGFCFISFLFYIMTEKECSTETKTRAYITLWFFVGALIVILFMCSCSRYMSVNDAASGKAKCGQHLK